MKAMRKLGGVPYLAWILGVRHANQVPILPFEHHHADDGIGYRRVGRRILEEELDKGIDWSSP